MLTLGSLFDGIGGWQLAAVHNGVKPIWSSEIEPFPIAVTKYHFPETIQLGDVTKIDGSKIPPVDIICAGSPCQDLSVAQGSNRKGLKGERSRLFIDSIRIVRQMRTATGGKFPRFFCWENVPGAFSSGADEFGNKVRGADFRAVIEQVGQAEIPMPEDGRWAECGVVQLPGCEIAWRVIDAAIFVPQRRKRIFLICDFAQTGRCAKEILLIEPSLSGNYQQGKETWENSAGTIENSIGTADTEV